MIKKFCALILGMVLTGCASDLSKINTENVDNKLDLTKPIYITQPRDLNKEYARGSGLQVMSVIFVGLENISKEVNSAYDYVPLSVNFKNAKKEKSELMIVPVIKKWETAYLGLSDRVAIDFKVYDVKTKKLIYQTVVEDTNCPLYVNNTPELLMEDITAEFVRRSQKLKDLEN